MNDYSAIMPKILAQALITLRGQTVMPLAVNTDFGTEVKKKGETISMQIPSAATATDVVPSVTAPANADVTAATADIKLDNWKKSDFFLTDKELGEIDKGVVNMNIGEAAKALAEALNASVLSKYTGIYGYVGVAAQTPFGSDYSEATAARKILNLQRSPNSPRRMILDPDAEEAAINLKEFADAGFTNRDGTIIEGVIGRKLGFDWFYDQQIPTHTAGTLLANPLVNGTPAVGAKTMNIDKATLTGTVVVGDIFTIAGDTQTYVVTAAATASGNAIAGLAFSPGLVEAPADDAVITFKADHVVNIAFHRDAFGLAVRPLEAPANGLGQLILTAIDPVTRLPLRLTVSRENYQTRWALDILWGTDLVRPELATRVAG